MTGFTDEDSYYEAMEDMRDAQRDEMMVEFRCPNPECPVETFFVEGYPDSDGAGPPDGPPGGIRHFIAVDEAICKACGSEGEDI